MKEGAITFIRRVCYCKAIFFIIPEYRNCQAKEYDLKLASDLLMKPALICHAY